MRPSLCLVLLALGCAAPLRQAPAPAAAAPSAKPARDPASTVYRFEGVEVFGSRRYPAAELLALIGMPRTGTDVDLKDEAFWKELEASKARLQAKYAFAHCRYNLVAFPPTGLARITVDLVDAEDAWRLDFLPEPTATLEDPAGLIAAWQAYDAQKWALRNKGEIPLHGEPTCRAMACVSEFGHPTLAALEGRFLEGVPRHQAALVRVLREDEDAKRRMTVASLLTYGRSREEAIAALLPSVRDPDVGVRNEVLRSLGELQHRQQQQLLPLEPILAALWYPSTNDRNKAGWALVRIVEATGTAHRRAILEKSGEMLAMMTGLKTGTDSEPAVKVLELLSGKQLGADERAWRAWLAAQGVAAR